MNIVGSAAASARLAHQQRCFFKVITAVLQGVEHLPNDKQCRITSIIVDITQPRFNDLISVIFKQHKIIPRPFEHTLQKGEVNGQHHGH